MVAGESMVRAFCVRVTGEEIQKEKQRQKTTTENNDKKQRQKTTTKTFFLNHEIHEYARKRCGSLGRGFH
jgi:hypothetical protein